MNSKPFAPKYFIPVILVVCLSLVSIAWSGQAHQRSWPNLSTAVNDTTPKQKEKKIRDLDEAIDEMNNAELKLQMDKVNEEIRQAMKDIDMNKIKMELDRQMKEVDMQKLQEEVNKAMKEVDVEKIHAELDKAASQIDEAKIQKEIKESLAQVDMEKIDMELKKQMDLVQKIDMKKVEAEMDKVKMQMKDLQPQIEREMQKAKVQIENAKAEMKEYKSFVDGLESDGLINKNDDYSIQHKNGELIINGKQQPANVYDKYRDFLQKHKKFNIKKSNEGFNIDNGNEHVI